ncbi:MAG: FG-GAP-like repeat-containing protein [Acidobacteriota bacterium]
MRSSTGQRNSILRLLIIASVLALVNPKASGQKYVFGRLDFAAGKTPGSIAVGDFNGDGTADIAVLDVTQKTVMAFLGRPDGTFALRNELATGRTPLSLTVADFNGDRKSDIAVSNYDDHTVSILLGNGDGTFRPRVDYAAGFDPRQIIAVDIDRDGTLDLVTSNGSLSLSVLLGNGDGSFKNHIDFPSAGGAGAGSPGAVAAGDFNGNGRLDLAVPNQNANSVSVLTGNGDGTFGPFVTYETGIGPSAVTSGHFNGDGKLDLAVTNTGFSKGTQANSVSILIGNGDGTFRTHVDQPVGPNPAAIIATDLNHDGKADIITTNANCSGSCLFGSVSILLGEGDGTFRPHTDYGTGTAPSIAVADVNADGTPDLAIAHGNCIFAPCGPASISILLGNGDGTFSGNIKYPTGRNPSSVTSADFRQIGTLDLAVVNQFDNTISLLLGDGRGSFRPQTTVASGLASVYATAVDVNGDDKSDLVTTNGSDTVSILLGNGDGTFRPHVDYGTGSGPKVVITGDFNGDGKLDLAVLNGGQVFGNAVSILLGNGDGTFKPRSDFPAGMSASWVTEGDFNRDGKLDLAVSNNNGAGSVSILFGNGNGTFQAPIAYETAGFPPCVATGDFNGDGKLDLAIPRSGNTAGPLSVLLGNGDGTFRNRVDYPTGVGAGQVIVGDFNGDGRLDLGVISAQFNSVSILIGHGDGTFQDHLDFASGSQPLALTAADLDGDGGLDVVVTAAFPDNAISVLLNRPFIALFPAKLLFVAPAPGVRSATQTLLVSNPSSTPFSISSISVSGDFTETNNCPKSLAPGSSCSVNIAFVPRSIDPRKGVVTITDGAQNSPHTIALSGVTGRQRAVRH